MFNRPEVMAFSITVYMESIEGVPRYVPWNYTVSNIVFTCKIQHFEHALTLTELLNLAHARFCLSKTRIFSDGTFMLGLCFSI
jgi:hypothetical protein